MSEQEFQTDEFVLFCLKEYHRDNIADYNLSVEEFRRSRIKGTAYLNSFLDRKNKSPKETARLLEDWKSTFKKKNRTNSIFKTARYLFFLGVLVVFILVGWNWITRPKPIPPPNLNRLFVITTSGFWAHSLPTQERAYRDTFLLYGDSVTNLKDTTNEWIKFSRDGRVMYGPQKYFMHEGLFRKYDSLFSDYHFTQGQETINSKIMVCAHEFITNKLQSSTEEWYIPLQPLVKNQLHHAILSLPKTVDSVLVENEGKFQKYHLLLISHREPANSASVRHYLLLLELLPTGSVIRQEDFPLTDIEGNCSISIEDFSLFAKGVVNDNVFLEADGQKIVKLVWVGNGTHPKWIWVQ